MPSPWRDLISQYQPTHPLCSTRPIIVFIFLANFNELMDQMTTYEAIVFPCDDRPPHLEPLMTSTILIPLASPAEPFLCGRMPHPEVYMDYIAEG